MTQETFPQTDELDDILESGSLPIDSKWTDIVDELRNKNLDPKATKEDFMNAVNREFPELSEKDKETAWIVFLFRTGRAVQDFPK